MKKIVRLVVSGVLAFYWLSLPAVAGKRVALVIGNSGYTELQKLANPANDARLMAESLSGLGFEVVSALDADRREISRAVREFGQALRAGGQDAVGLFYFAGHGVQARGVNYLIPLNAEIIDEADLDIEAISTADILSQMETAGNRLNLVILDACRNNPFRGRMRSATRGLARIQAASGSLVAFAAAPGQVAADGTGKHSPYTKALVEAMHEPGLAVEQVFKRVRIAVEKETGRRQTPWEESSLRGDFYFVPLKTDVTKTTGPVLSPAAQEWTAIQNTTSQAVLEAFIRRHPDSAYAEYARVRLAETTESNAVPDAEAPPAPAETKPDERVAALSEESPGETGPDEAPDRRELSLALQRELKRVGCDPGAIDGDWGPKSRRALKTFAEHGNKQLASLDPSADVLDAVKATKSRVCPLECGPGKKLEGDRCIADPETTTPAPASLDGVWIMTTRNNAHCTRRNIPAATVTVSGSRLSWTNSMGAYRVATLSGSGLYQGRAKSSLGGMLRYSIRLDGRSGSGSWHIVDGKCAGSLSLRRR